MRLLALALADYMTLVFFFRAFARRFSDLASSDHRFDDLASFALASASLSLSSVLVAASRLSLFHVFGRQMPPSLTGLGFVSYTGA